LASLQEFEEISSEEFQWPLSSEVLINYSTWALIDKELQPSTVEAYLSSLATLHSMQGLQNENFKHILVKATIRGARKVGLNAQRKRPDRFVMSMQILKLLGHEIASSSWSKMSKQVVWAACCCAFFGCLRMGEILAKNQSTDRFSALRWEDISFSEGNHILIHLRQTKTSFEGDFVDLFEFPNEGCCPVSSLRALRKLAEEKENFSIGNPVFQFESGLLLTVEKFTDTVRKLLSGKLGRLSEHFSAHSFRAGLPSIIAKFPEIADATDIMHWGRWGSACYTSYTRLKLTQKQKLFAKIARALKSDCRN
jgi:hypothetical protein